MTKCQLMTLTCLFIFVTQFSLSDVIIKDVNAAIHLQNDRYMILYGGEEHQASIYDAVNDEMIRDVVRTGRGPGESESLSAFYHDTDSNTYFFGDEAGQLFLFNSEFELIELTRLGNYVMTDIHADSDYIWISIRAMIAEETTMTEPHTSVLKLDRESLTIVDEIIITLKDLALDQVDNIDRIRLLYFSAGLKSYNNSLWLTFDYFPFLFRLDEDGSIGDSYRFTDEQTLEVVQRNGLRGTRTISICTNSQLIGSHVYCWKGNAGQDIDYGWYALDLENPSDAATSGAIDDVGGEEGMLRIIQGETTAAAFIPALFFGEGSSYLLRSERTLVDGD